jgi:hypothetical protein
MLWWPIVLWQCLRVLWAQWVCLQKPDWQSQTLWWPTEQWMYLRLLWALWEFL